MERGPRDQQAESATVCLIQHMVRLDQYIRIIQHPSTLIGEYIEAVLMWYIIYCNRVTRRKKNNKCLQGVNSKIIINQLLYF